MISKKEEGTKITSISWDKTRIQKKARKEEKGEATK